MKKIAAFIVIISVMVSCTNKADKGRFIVTGDIKHIDDQKIYLEEIYFNDKNPEVLDTGDIKQGKFTLSAVGDEEGLYRLRPANFESGFLFINDNPTITFTADIENPSLLDPTFNSPANTLLKNFIATIETQKTGINKISDELTSLKQQPGSDSLVQVKTKEQDEKTSTLKNYIAKYIDTVSSPVMAMLAPDFFNKRLDIAQLEKAAASLGKRFPKHQGAVALATKYSQMIAEYKATPHVGSMAPDIKMTDTSGHPFALSSLRGKYVLVDFWASWCGPCRAENPNVVKAYNAFKDKNFTVLGVSLDKSKDAWVNAINTDKLTWNHISDLQYWSSAAVGLYGFSAIPYNVLIDPQGKIIGVSLMGQDLENKLTEVLK